MHAFRSKEIVVPPFVKERFVTARAFPKAAVIAGDHECHHPRNCHDCDSLVVMKKP
jgi:hypothetical protein